MNELEWIFIVSDHMLEPSLPEKLCTWSLLSVKLNVMALLKQTNKENRRRSVKPRCRCSRRDETYSELLDSLVPKLLILSNSTKNLLAKG